MTGASHLGLISSYRCDYFPLRVLQKNVSSDFLVPYVCTTSSSRKADKKQRKGADSVISSVCRISLPFSYLLELPCVAEVYRLRP